MSREVGPAVAVVGGSGAVGRQVAERLAPQLPGRVVVAGRNRDRSDAVAREVGQGTLGDALDVGDATTFASVLSRAGVVVSCVERSDPLFARACLTAGVHYVDVTADGGMIAAIEALDPIARTSGAVAVLSVGLAPGLTNLLARQACSMLDRVDRLDLGVQLNALDTHGAAAIDWTLENLTAPFLQRDLGHERVVRPLAGRRSFDFGGTHAHRAFAFNFPEQRTLARTLDVPTAASWLSLRPQVIHSAAVASVRLRLTGLLRFDRVRRGIVAGAARLPKRTAGCAASVQASGTGNGRRVCISNWRAGHGEAALTAGVASYLAAYLLRGTEAAGVKHVEQLEMPGDLLAELSEALDLDGPPAPRCEPTAE